MKPSFNLPMPILDLSQLGVYPLSERRNPTQGEDILVDPKSAPKADGATAISLLNSCGSLAENCPRRNGSLAKSESQG